MKTKKQTVVAKKAAKTAKPAKKTTKSAKPQAKHEIPREPAMLPIEQLHVAPWNPRGKITPESVSDLVPSIEAKGLIQRIAVVLDLDSEVDDMHYTVIAGNRRLVACQVCGMKEVPCEKFHCTEAEARQLTLIENLKRKDAEPIYVAKVIQTLRDEDKLTTEEIAAEIGMPESWVVRRAKLIDLAPEWKQAVEEGTISVTTDLLEKASRYTLDIQQDAYHEIVRSYETSVRLSWRDVSREFDSRVRNLEKAPFDRKKCAICPYNSACHPTLWDFGEAPTDGAFGVCLDPRCFALKKSEAENAKLAKIMSKGITVVKVKDYFAVPMDAIASPDDNHKFACVYHDYNGNLAVRYATKDPTANEDEKKSVNTTDKERAKSLKEAVKKVKEWEKENLESWIKKRTDFPDDLSFAANIFALALIYRVNNGSFRYTLNDLARDIWHEAKIVRLHVVSELSSAIQDLEDASASITLSTFEAANDAVSLEERNLVLRGK